MTRSPGSPATPRRLIELGRDLRDDEITVLEGWAGDLYGIPVESTVEAIRLSGRLEGMIIDPVYEGKSMAGLVDLVTSGEIGRGLDGALRPPRRTARPQRLRGDLRLTAPRPQLKIMQLDVACATRRPASSVRSACASAVRRPREITLPTQVSSPDSRVTGLRNLVVRSREV